MPQPRLDALPLGAHSLSVLTDEALFAACGVRVAFTGRQGGVSAAPYASLNTAGHVGDDMANVERNRAIVLESLGCEDAPCIVPNQVHGANIVHVESSADVPRAAAEAKEGADAVLVEACDVAALMNFADCLSFIIVAPSGRFVVGHAGWRGALAGIVGKAARELVAAGSPDCDVPEALNVYIGPHICADCFETSAEIAAQFADAFDADVLKDDRHVSLARAVETDLARAGVSPDRVVDSGACSVCDNDRYFSYRVEGVCGRHAAVAVRICGKGAQAEEG